MYCNFSKFNVIFEDRLSPPTLTPLLPHTHLLPYCLLQQALPSPLSPVLIVALTSPYATVCATKLPLPPVRYIATKGSSNSVAPQLPIYTPPSPCLPHPLYVRSAHLLHRFRKLCKEPPKKAERSALLLPSCRVCARNKVSNDTSPRTTHCHAPFATATTLLPGPGQV